MKTPTSESPDPQTYRMPLPDGSIGMRIQFYTNEQDLFIGGHISIPMDELIKSPMDLLATNYGRPFVEMIRLQLEVAKANQ